MAPLSFANFAFGRRAARFLRPEAACLVLGVTLATGSGLFAAHSIATNDGRPNLPAVIPTGDLMTWKKGIAEYRIARGDFDPVTTGSIPQAKREAGAAPAPRFADALAVARSEPMASYVLVDVSDGVAVIEGTDGVRHVRLGSVLPGAGRIAAIERTQAGWIVVTSQGVIRGMR